MNQRETILGLHYTDFLIKLFPDSIPAYQAIKVQIFDLLRETDERKRKALESFRTQGASPEQFAELEREYQERVATIRKRCTSSGQRLLADKVDPGEN